MGHGDNEIIPTDDELVEAEQATRRLFARWGEPIQVTPPSTLNASVRAGLQRRWFHPALQRITVGIALALLFCIVPGIWIIFGTSAVPLDLFGGPEQPLTRVILTLVLALKPVVNLVAPLMFYIIPLLLVSPLVIRFWLRIFRAATPAEVA